MATRILMLVNIWPLVSYSFWKAWAAEKKSWLAAHCRQVLRLGYQCVQLLFTWVCQTANGCAALANPRAPIVVVEPKSILILYLASLNGVSFLILPWNSNLWQEIAQRQDQDIHEVRFSFFFQCFLRTSRADLLSFLQLHLLPSKMLHQQFSQPVLLHFMLLQSPFWNRSLQFKRR